MAFHFQPISYMKWSAQTTVFPSINLLLMLCLMSNVMPTDLDSGCVLNSSIDWQCFRSYFYHSKRQAPTITLILPKGSYMTSRFKSVQANSHLNICLVLGLRLYTIYRYSLAANKCTLDNFWSTFWMVVDWPAKVKVLHVYRHLYMNLW